MEPATLRGAEREGWSPHPGKRPRQPACGSRTEWGLHTGTAPSPAHPAWEGVRRCRQGLGAGMWGLESRPRQSTAMGGEETPCGNGREVGALQTGMLGEEAWTTLAQSTIAESCPKRRPIIVCSLSPAVRAPPHQAWGRAPARVGALTMLAAAFSSVPPPYQGRLVGSGKPREQVPMGHPHAQRGLNTAEPQSLEIKEVKLKSSIGSCTSSSLYHHSCFCNLSPYRASEWTRRAPPVTAGVAVAAGDFVRSHTRGWGQAGVWATPTAPQQVQLHDECNSGTWVQGIYAGDPGKTTSERPQGHVPAYPWLRWGQDQCQPRSHETHTMCKRWPTEHIQGEHPQSSNLQGLLSRWCAPIPPASIQIRITAKRQIWGLCSTNQGSDPPQTGRWQPQSDGEAPSISRAGSGHSNNNQSPD